MPHRQMLSQLVDRYQMRYPEEAQMIERLQAFIRDNPDCFKRQLAVGHVTGSAWLLDAQGMTVLMTHHKKLNIWVQLGGHADGESDIAQVAMREAHEESGLDNLGRVIDFGNIKEILGMGVTLTEECIFLLSNQALGYLSQTLLRILGHVILIKASLRL